MNDHDVLCQGDSWIESEHGDYECPACYEMRMAEARGYRDAVEAIRRASIEASVLGDTFHRALETIRELADTLTIDRDFADDVDDLIQAEQL